MSDKYPILEEMNVFELAELLKLTKEYDDKEFRNEILKEFGNRDEERLRSKK